MSFSFSALFLAFPSFAGESKHGSQRKVDAGSWLSHGRTAAEQRYSPLDSIDTDNIATLQRAWTLDTGTTRGLEATPIFVDGVLYTTLTWSVVLAVDARTGTVIWRYDPEVPKDVGRKACCDVVNRGVAVQDGRVYVGTP